MTGIRKLGSGGAVARSVLPAVAVTVLAYLPTFGNGFTNWDDDHYVTANRFVQHVSAANVLHHFTSFTAGNHHPLTLLVSSAIYRVFGPEPQAFHGASLLLHLLNVVLVHRVAAALGAPAAGARAAALLFGVHPLHVESVAWAAELKDVLCTCFFLGAVLTHLRWIDGGRRRTQYALGLLLALLALLSKPMAVTLPLVLLLCDRMRGRRLDARTLLEKVPHLLLALAFGAVALASQREALRGDEVLDLGRNALVAAHGALFYLAKALAPANLSALYPLPEGPPGLPASYVAALPALLALAGLTAWVGRRSRLAWFAGLSYLATVAPVLQVLPVGNAVAADRYFYLPSFGLCVAAGAAYARLIEALRPVRPRAAGHAALAGSCAVAAFAAISFARVPVWRDSLTLWGDVLAKHPRSYLAHGYRGMAHAARGEAELALADFDRALELGGDRRFAADVHYNRGALYHAQGRLADALADYESALAVDPGLVKALVNKGNALDALGRPREALEAYAAGLALAPGNPLLHYNRGLVRERLGEDARAAEDYDEALRLDPWLAPALVNRGLLRARSGLLAAAVEDFTRAAALDPDSAALFENRGRAYEALGDAARAQADRRRARELRSRAARAAP